ncbi:MAG: hypothetical protein V4480_03195 [Patescibacteria group bacterium]
MIDPAHPEYIHVDLARHLPQVPPKSTDTWDLGADLAPGHRLRAHRIRMAHLNGIKYRRVGSTQVKRGILSTQLLVPDYTKIETFDWLSPHDDEDWSFLATMAPAPVGFLAQACCTIAPLLIRAKGLDAFLGIHRIVNECDPGDSVFLTTHCPIAEMGIGVALEQNQPVQDLEKGEIARFAFTPAGKFVALTRLPVPTG